jgi:hypothetical protein
MLNDENAISGIACSKCNTDFYTIDALDMHHNECYYPFESKAHMDFLWQHAVCNYVGDRHPLEKAIEMANKKFGIGKGTQDVKSKNL